VCGVSHRVARACNVDWCGTGESGMRWRGVLFGGGVAMESVASERSSVVASRCKAVETATKPGNTGTPQQRRRCMHKQANERDGTASIPQARQSVVDGRDAPFLPRKWRPL
jgi:hypothetical protein